jgi:uncharacterized membrane protein
MLGFHLLDGIAVLIFAASWLGFGLLVDRSPLHRRTLTYAMNKQRRRWMEAMAARDNRIADTAIMGGLQNGTAFFASASLLAIGAAFSLLGATDQVLAMMRDLQLAAAVTRGEWEAKTLGLAAIYAYAFFKFGWSYRLFNYTSILIGATPSAAERDTPQSRQAVTDAAEMNILAGRHFSLGLRAFFFSVGYMGWFAHAWGLIGLTLVIVGVLGVRQFGSAASRLVRHDPP